MLHMAVVPMPYTALLPHTVPLCRSWGTYFILKMAVNQEQKPCAERRQEDLTSVCAPIFLLPPPKVWETRSPDHKQPPKCAKLQKGLGGEGDNATA